MYTVPDQHGRTVVVTGANSGTGREAANRLAAAGAHVVLAVRNPAKGAQALTDLLTAHPDAHAEVRIVDLADLASVAAFADGLGRDLDHLDTLVNNAGVMAPPTRFETTDGFELQMGSNFLGPFSLTNRLLPLLLAGPAPRVSTMSSGTANFGRIHFDDLQWTRRYRPALAYAQSKLADLYLATHLAVVAGQRGWSLLSNAAHPGFTRTNLQTTGPTLGRTGPHRTGPGLSSLLPSMLPPEGTGPLLLAATSPQAEQGGYYGPQGRFSLVGEAGPAWRSRHTRDAATAARLWDVAEDLTGTALPHR